MTREVSNNKAYFQHFDAAQRAKLIDLLNSQQVSIGYPGHFYVLPFFCLRATPGTDAAVA